MECEIERFILLMLLLMYVGVSSLLAIKVRKSGAERLASLRLGFSLIFMMIAGLVSGAAIVTSKKDDADDSQSGEE